MSNALQVAREIRTDEYKAELVLALPSHCDLERFTRMAVTILKNPKIAACSPDSLRMCVMEAAHLGLFFDDVLGHAYVVPYKGIATFILGYRGYIELALRSGRVHHVETAIVYEGDQFDYRLGTNAFLDHRPIDDMEQCGERIAAWCKVVYPNGMESFEVMRRGDIERIRGRSYSPAWNTDTDMMYRKSPLIRHMKTRGITPELTRYAVQEEYYEAGLGRDPKEIEAKVTKTAELLEKINGGKQVEEPVESESAPAGEKPPLTKSQRANLKVDHAVLSTKVGRRRLSASMLDEMSDNTLTDAVEVLRQDVAKLTTSPQNQSQSPSGPEDSPFPHSE